jgi:hypothetical protein
VVPHNAGDESRPIAGRMADELQANGLVERGQFVISVKVEPGYCREPPNPSLGEIRKQQNEGSGRLTAITAYSLIQSSARIGVTAPRDLPKARIAAISRRRLITESARVVWYVFLSDMAMVTRAAEERPMSGGGRKIPRRIPAPKYPRRVCGEASDVAEARDKNPGRELRSPLRE